MGDINFEATEDPLKDLTSHRVQEDEEDEEGAGVDYRRLFKGKDKKKFQKIPKRGEKDFEPDGTRKQQNVLQEGRDAMYSALSFDAGLYNPPALPKCGTDSYCRKHGASCGVWIEEYEMTHVPRDLCTGTWFQNLGVGGPTGHWLLPEETLLMVSAGRMELLDEDGLKMGLFGTWGACIEAARGVNTYLIYSQLRRAGYHVFRQGYLKRSAASAIEDMKPSLHKRDSSWRQIILDIYTTFYALLVSIWAFPLLQYMPSWLVARPHRPYHPIYASLPPISTFSESSSAVTRPLAVTFEVWRPNPQWKRRAPGPPDFHICVVDGRETFPSLAQLEQLYNSVAQNDPVGGKGGGKVVIAVVDSGVSNYMTLGDGLFNASEQS